MPWSWSRAARRTTARTARPHIYFDSCFFLPVLYFTGSKVTFQDSAGQGRHLLFLHQTKRAQAFVARTWTNVHRDSRSPYLDGIFTNECINYHYIKGKVSSWKLFTFPSIAAALASSPKIQIMYKSASKCSHAGSCSNRNNSIFL